jgi:hypothetical protein
VPAEPGPGCTGSIASGPVVYVDVDGVVNRGWFTDPGLFGALRARGWHAGRVAGCPGPGRAHEAYRVVLDPAWGGLLRGLADLGAELVWATGWNEGANRHIGPLLGLPELPVAPAVHGAKAATVIPWAGGRPWAWLEDDPAELRAAAARARPGVPCLPVLVDRDTGLVPDDAARVAAWLGSLPPAAPPAGGRR